MARKQKFAEHTRLRELAMEILLDRAKDRQVCLRVQALMNSEDTLSPEEVFEELTALKQREMAFTNSLWT